MLGWGMEELVHEVKDHPRFKEKASKPLEEIDSDFLVGLIGRKFENYAFRGQFLFWGFPRKINDIKLLRSMFMRELRFKTFSWMLKPDSTEKEQADIK